MRLSYPTSWTSTNGNDCLIDGELTAQGKNWFNEIQVLTANQMRIGMKRLIDLKTNGFAPSAIQFVAHCRDIEMGECTDEIWDMIRREPDSNLWWKSNVAYTVYQRLYYNPSANQMAGKVQEQMERIYKSIDHNNLMPVPDRVLSLPDTSDDYHLINDEKGYRQFIGRIVGLICANESEIVNISKKINLVMPDLTREWWPEFKTSAMKVGDWLREVKGLNFPKEPKHDDPMVALLGMTINNTIQDNL